MRVPPTRELLTVRKGLEKWSALLASRSSGGESGTALRRRGVSLRNSHNFSRDILGGKDKIDAPGRYRAFGHIRLRGCLKLLCNGDAARFLYAAQRRCAVAVIAGDNDRDQFAVPVQGKGVQKNGDDVRPSPRL